MSDGFKIRARLYKTTKSKGGRHNDCCRKKTTNREKRTTPDDNTNKGSTYREELGRKAESKCAGAEESTRQ